MEWAKTETVIGVGKKRVGIYFSVSIYVDFRLNLLRQNVFFWHRITRAIWWCITGNWTTFYDAFGTEKELKITERHWKSPFWLCASKAIHNGIPEKPKQSVLRSVSESVAFLSAGKVLHKFYTTCWQQTIKKRAFQSSSADFTQFSTFGRSKPHSRGVVELQSHSEKQQKLEFPYLVNDGEKQRENISRISWCNRVKAVGCLTLVLVCKVHQHSTPMPQFKFNIFSFLLDNISFSLMILFDFSSTAFKVEHRKALFFLSVSSTVRCRPDKRCLLFGGPVCAVYYLCTHVHRRWIQIIAEASSRDSFFSYIETLKLLMTQPFVLWNWSLHYLPGEMRS